MNPPLLSVSLLAGTLLLFLLPRLPSSATLLAVALVTLLLFSKWRCVWTAIAMTVVAGFVWAAFHAQLGLNSRLAAEAGRIDVRLDGTVVSLIRETDDTLAFQIETRLPFASDRPVRVDLRWYEFPDDARRPLPGEIWRFHARLRTPRGSANPGRRYWEDHAFRHGIAASGYVRHGENHYLATRFWRGSVERLRDNLSRELIDTLKDHETAPIIVALAVGDRQHLTDAHWQILRRTGLSHLVAISGLHIGIVAGLAYALGAALSGGQRRGIALACLASAGLALSYAALAGFTIPTQRALIVVMVFLAARLSRRSVRPVYALSIALTVILSIDPMSVLDAGFWLSFAAVAVILYSGAGQLARGAWRDLLRMQFAVLIGLTPLMIILFGQVSLAAPLVNFVILPLFSLLLVPAVLTGVAAFMVHQQTGLVILGLVAELLDRLWPALAQISEFGLLARQSGTPTVAAIALAVFGALWWLAPRGWPARGLGVICLLPALLSPAQRPAPGGFELTVLDVGQGLAAVVRTHRHVLIFDTGPKWRNGGNAAQRILIPYLQRTGVSQIDRVVISHGDADHAGGLRTVSENFPGVAMLASHVAGLDACQRGQRWFWDGVGFEILHPPAGTVWSGNDASCVLRIANGNHCVLLTGDIEADAERALVRDAAARLRCELVLAPHHGSETSSTRQFVAAAGARYVVVSASYTNPWGFPRPAVVDRWQRSGAIVINTATGGAISARADAGGAMSLQQHRCEHRRFWRPGCR